MLVSQWYTLEVFDMKTSHLLQTFKLVWSLFWCKICCQCRFFHYIRISSISGRMFILIVEMALLKTLAKTLVKEHCPMTQPPSSSCMIKMLATINNSKKLRQIVFCLPKCIVVKKSCEGRLPFFPYVMSYHMVDVNKPFTLFSCFYVLNENESKITTILPKTSIF